MSSRYWKSRDIQNSTDAPRTLSSWRATPIVIVARPWSRSVAASGVCPIRSANSTTVRCLSRRRSAMVSPGAEAQSGLNAWPLGIVPFYAEYLNPTNPLPVYFLRIRHWTLDMVRLEHNTMSIAHVDNHMLAVSGDARHTSQ